MGAPAEESLVLDSFWRLPKPGFEVGKVVSLF